MCAGQGGTRDPGALRLGTEKEIKRWEKTIEKRPFGAQRCRQAQLQLLPLGPRGL